MSELEKAARQALEALNLAWAAHGQMLMSDPPQEAWKAWNVSTAIRESMIALRQALAEDSSGTKQPAQEPVAYASSIDWRKNQLMSKAQFDNCLPKNRVDFDVPLYARPQAREPLTREQVKALTKETGYDTASRQERADFINGIRHAEAAHGIKGDA